MVTNNEKLLSVATVRAFLECNFDTGALTWKHRDSIYFSSSSRRSAEHIANNWNSIYAGKTAFTATHRNRYLIGAIGGKNYFAHRVIYAMRHGAWPEKSIDHIDGNGLNNNIKNLRDVSHSENMRNVKAHNDNSTGFIGVSFSKVISKFEARIHVNGRPQVIGYFPTAEDANVARLAANKSNGYHENHGRKM